MIRRFLSPIIASVVVLDLLILPNLMDAWGHSPLAEDIPNTISMPTINASALAHPRFNFRSMPESISSSQLPSVTGFNKLQPNLPKDFSPTFDLPIPMRPTPSEINNQTLNGIQVPTAPLFSDTFSLPPMTRDLGGSPLQTALPGMVFDFDTDESSKAPGTLGKIEASYKYVGAVTGFPTMKATFDLTSTAALQLDVDKGCEFRWFQVITYLDPMPEGAVGIPATWKGNKMDSYGTPFVDPPAGGYDYQPEGDDFQPFYWNTKTEWPYMHEEGKSTTIVDTPTRPWEGEKVFVTCLVLYCPKEDPNSFYLTENGCFTWSLETRDHGSYIGLVISEPKPVPNSNSSGYVAFLEGALDRSGFPGWSIEPAYSINGNPTNLVFASVD